MSECLIATRQIDQFFAKVHPELGAGALSPTGEPYVTYAIVRRTREEAADALVNTFRVMVQGTALIKPEGAPTCIDVRGPHYLYWRRQPDISLYDEPGHVPALVGQWWKASCRAVVSDKWVDGAGSSAIPEFHQETLEALLMAVYSLRNTRGLRVQMRARDVLLPEVVAQIPKGLS